MSQLPGSAFCLVILADADPVILIRLVERIQSLALVPQQLFAQWLTDDQVSIELVCAGLDDPGIETLARRISQFMTVHSAIWKRVPEAPVIG
jgi:hypothetical protein